MTIDSLFSDLIVVIVGGALGAFVAGRNRSSTPPASIPSQRRAPPPVGRASCPPPHVNRYGELDEP